MRNRRRRRLAILVGGGPAPGINGVIAAVVAEAVRRGLEVLGIYDGFKWLSRGHVSHVRRLTIRDAEQARFRGGSILGTSRLNPTERAASMRNVVKALRRLGIQYLVTIGGDDTAFSAFKTSAYARGAIKVAHVPKTIDNDLPLPDHIPTFGFQTAVQVGSHLVRNLVEDARTTSRWYIVSAMGRNAGHLALGIGAAGGASLALIPEEFPRRNLSLDRVCSLIEGAIVKAKALGQNHGVAVVAEGIAELLAEELKNHPLAKDNPLVEFAYDDHKHLRLEGIPFALILKRLLQQRAKARGDTTTSFVDAKLGYELRCADPIPYDVEYTQQLGWGAVQYLLGHGKKTWPRRTALISIRAGKLAPIPFSKVLNKKTGRTAVRPVDLRSDPYQSARAAMVRLEPEPARPRNSSWH